MDHDIRRFTAYRPLIDKQGTHNDDQMNAPEEVQYEGVIFTDGTCVIRWRTAVGSFSIWESFEAAMRIHGHPEYGTRIVFHDDPVPLPWDKKEEFVEQSPQKIKKNGPILCGIRGCTNQATHRWSGHPTCDPCGSRGQMD